MRVRARARQRGVELPLVVSDHADWPELIDTIAATGAPEVWITHGREEALVHALTSRGPDRAAPCRSSVSRTRGTDRWSASPSLLDRLVYSAIAQRQIAAHRRLFPHHPRSRPRLCPGRSDRRPAAAPPAPPHPRRARRALRRSGAVPPVARLCRRQRRDRCAALARPPRRQPALARPRRRSPAALLGDHPQGRAGARPRLARRPRLPRAASRC